jgi:hypothetical protein
MPTEVLENIFAAAIPDRVIVKDTRDFTEGLGLKCQPKRRGWRPDWIHWTPQWTYELLNVSKRLRAIIGTILYARIVITPWFFLSRRSSSRFLAASEMRHEPTRYSGKKVRPFSVCEIVKHELDRKLREMCGLPSACILEEENEDVLSRTRARVDERGD